MAARRLAGGRDGSVAREKQRLAGGVVRARPYMFMESAATKSLFATRRAGVAPASRAWRHGRDDRAANACGGAPQPRSIMEEETTKRYAGRIWPERGGAPASHGVRHEAGLQISRDPWGSSSLLDHPCCVQNAAERSCQDHGRVVEDGRGAAMLRRAAASTVSCDARGRGVDGISDTVRPQGSWQPSDPVSVGQITRIIARDIFLLNL